MIVTCPRCFATYRVPDKAMPAQGRRVRCSGCQFEWTEMPAAHSVEPAAHSVEPAAHSSEEEYRGDVFQPEETAARPPQTERVGRMADPVSSIESVRERMVRRGEETQRKEESKKKKKAEKSKLWQQSVLFLQWSGLVLASLLVVFAVFREPIGVHSPFFADLYEEVGVPVHTVYHWFDVKIDSLETKEEGGSLSVVFSGRLSNISRRDRTTPQIQFYLPKAGGKGWVDAVIRPEPSHLGAGESASFSAKVSNVDLRAGGSLNFLLYAQDEPVMDIDRKAEEVEKKENLEQHESVEKKENKEDKAH